MHISVDSGSLSEALRPRRLQGNSTQGCLSPRLWAFSANASSLPAPSSQAALCLCFIRAFLSLYCLIEYPLLLSLHSLFISASYNFLSKKIVGEIITR